MYEKLGICILNVTLISNYKTCLYNSVYYFSQILT